MNPFSLKGEGGENTCKLSHSGVNNSTLKTGDLMSAKKGRYNAKKRYIVPPLPPYFLQVFFFIKFKIPGIFGKVQMEVPILYPWLIGEKENLIEEKFKEKERKMKDFFYWKFLCVLEITQLNIIVP